MYRRFVMISMSFVLVMLVLFGSIVYLIDPFCHYHMPWFGLQATPTNQVYYNPGIAEHAEYDSAIIGSSMVENFKVSWFDELFGGETVKLPLFRMSV